MLNSTLFNTTGEYRLGERSSISKLFWLLSIPILRSLPPFWVCHQLELECTWKYLHGSVLDDLSEINEAATHLLLEVLETKMANGVNLKLFPHICLWFLIRGNDIFGQTGSFSGWADEN